MLISTRAIVLNYTKFNDSSIIVNVYTEILGIQAIMVYGITGKKRNKLTAFQPLFLQEQEIYHKRDRSIQKIKEFKLSPPLYKLCSDIRKSSISIFIAEVLTKCLKEESQDSNLFEFIYSSIQILDEIEEGIPIFHLAFLSKLTMFLGFAPPINESCGYYNLNEGSIEPFKPQHNNYCDSEIFEKMKLLYQTPYNKIHNIPITSTQRNKTIKALLKLYKLHVTNFNKLKSYSILQDVFNVI